MQLSEDLQVDYESYEWAKMDPESEETKKTVSDYFTMDDFKVDGKALYSAKCFK